MKALAVLLIVAGILMTMLTSFDVDVKNDVVQINNAEVTSRNTNIFWSPVTGAVMAVAGVLIIMISRRKAPRRMHRTLYW